MKYFSLLMLLLLFSGFFSQIGVKVGGEGRIVSAAASGCCSVDKVGKVCVETTKDMCSGIFISANCSDASFCKKGCCYNEESGKYSKGVIKEKCKGANEKWFEDAFCEISQAKEGCCNLGDFFRYTTQRECEVYSRRAGAALAKWEKGISEEDCLKKNEKPEDLGACKLDNTCKMGTRDFCSNKKGVFYKGFLCTAKVVNSTCKPTEKTQCFEGKDGVYFVDSCGNRANIYDSFRKNDESYWEKIIPRDKSCNDGKGNRNSKTCGNCNRFEGSICGKNGVKPVYGEHVCKDLSCEFNGKKYENGESWCYSDSTIGGGKDAPGSRHVVYSCNYGKIKIVKMCGERRESVCVEDKTSGRTNASCLKNPVDLCIGYNARGKEGLKQCIKNELCEVKKINVDDKVFNFEVCVPKVPPGRNFTLTSEKRRKSENRCKIASQTCVIVKMKKSVFGGRKTIGKKCGTEVFAQQMNDFCNSLGDCGADVNYEGIYTENYEVSHSPRLSPSWIDSHILSKTRDKRYLLDALMDTQAFERGFLDIRENGHKRGFFRRYEDFVQSEAHFITGNIPGNNVGIKVVRGVVNVVLNAYFSIVNLPASILGLMSHSDKKIKVHFECKPWEPPATGKYCDLCNKDSVIPCSEYRCRSLGAPCVLINKGTKFQKCVDGNPNDVTPPKISLDKKGMENYNVEEVEEGIKLKSKEGDGCFVIGKRVNLSLTTDEPAECGVSFQPESFENMSQRESFYVLNHSFNLFLPDPEPGVERKDDWRGKVNAYVKCRDTHNSKNGRPFVVSMCVKKIKDVFAPVIKKVIPKSGGLVGFDVKEQKVLVFTDEVAECRWDYEDKEFEKMNNSMVCLDDFGRPSSAEGYVCHSKILLTNESENKFYFRCKDKPWETNESLRVANEKSFVYSLKRPKKRIEITSVSPKGTIKSGEEFTKVNIRVSTIGGSEKHVCYFSLDGKNYIAMLKTGRRGSHTQKNLKFPAGENHIYVRCEDRIGDVAKKDWMFNIDYDRSSPEIIYIYKKGGKIHFKTSEFAECKYSEEDCNFGWKEGKGAGTGITHEISVETSETYYIKCKDSLGNMEDGCGALISVQRSI